MGREGLRRAQKHDDIEFWGVDRQRERQEGSGWTGETSEWESLEWIWRAADDLGTRIWIGKRGGKGKTGLIKRVTGSGGKAWRRVGRGGRSASSRTLDIGRPYTVTDSKHEEGRMKLPWPLATDYGEPNERANEEMRDPRVTLPWTARRGE